MNVIRKAEEMNAPIKHPTGETKRSKKIDISQPIPVDTYDGRIYMRWDNTGKLTPNGQLPFFIEFLKAGGLFDRWVGTSPLRFKSNNAPNKRDILGTILLSVLSGHTRYTHTSSLHYDPVNSLLLGMKKIVSEDAIRRALLHNITEETGNDWLEQSLNDTYLPLLTEHWALDVDTTIKTLYGKQESATVGYNPHKPGRPSHTYHSYMISNLRLILDVDVHAGNEHASKHTTPGLWRLMERIPRTCWPAFIRGDCGFGTDSVMTECEALKLPYLFKLKKTSLVKQLIRNYLNHRDWYYAGQGWEGVDSKIGLTGWTKRRRVIILRRAIKNELAMGAKKKNTLQLAFDFADVEEALTVYEYAVLITSLKEDLDVVANHYRDRADCENNFDELKNQWGWSGFTTQDLKRCRLMAKSIALIYNWWTLFIRLITPNKHTEAITSRPMLLTSAGRLTHHSKQKRISICNTHAKARAIYEKLVTISAFFKTLYQTTEQLTAKERWRIILSRCFVKYLKGKLLKPPNFTPALV